ncbi:hypothetical protein H0H93_016283 [Arthromyces matolae]|nr:hypothetical protein H0H93_016283 [Arthromyces matolae]
MANRKGKGKALRFTPSPEPNTEDEDNQLIHDLRQATLESKTAIPLRSSSTLLGEGPSQPAVSVDNNSSHHQAHETISSDDDFLDDEHAETFLDAAEEQLHGKSSQRSKGTVYVVYKGRKPGVYETWDACHDQVDGFPHNSYESFRRLQDAQDAWNHSLAVRTVGPPGSSSTHLSSLFHTPPKARVQAPRTPASADRLAAITEGLRMKTGEPGRKATQPRHHATTRQKSEHETPRNEFNRHAHRRPLTARWGSADAQRNQPIPQVADGVPFLDEESLWYVVVEGRRPGVYQGRSIAARAIGRGVTGVVRVASTEHEANRMFVNLYMSHEVKRIE